MVSGRGYWLPRQPCWEKVAQAAPQATVDPVMNRTEGTDARQSLYNPYLLSLDSL